MALSPAQEQANRLADDIMTLSRNRLTVDLRYMANPLSMLDLTQMPGLNNVMTDGVKLYYDPVHILQSYQGAKEMTVRKYLHLVLHCVYQHFYVGVSVEREYWDLACDIAVEAAITDINLSSAAVPGGLEQRAAIAKIASQVRHMTAEMIYRYLLLTPMSDPEINKLKELFSIDSHEIWYKPGKQDDTSGEEGEEEEEEQQEQAQSKNSQGNGQTLPGASSTPETPHSESGESAQGKDTQQGGTDGMSFAQLEKLRDDWKQAAEKMRLDIEAFSAGKLQGQEAGSGLMDSLNYAVRERYDYSTFLRQFGALTETMKINQEEFDYSFYTYGMDLYGNMPLIEPLEYKDTKKVREFVIAIDTSGSTSGDLVQMFLRKTYNILMERESFRTKVNVHIIQCDAKIQEDVKITNRNEFEEYMRTMKIRGLGGTDFRPVFEHVNDLIQDGELAHLKGLIYFTDGYGTFPEHQPPYKSAFVFVNDGFDDPQIPVWGIKLVLEPEEIEDVR